MHAASISDDSPPQGAVGAWATRAQRQLGRLLGVPVALLVAAEIAVLLAGVVARYVFHHPLIWSDEVASILFLWLAMLGSAVAFQRGEHMRMTAVVGKLAPSTRAFLDVLATAAAAWLLRRTRVGLARFTMAGREASLAMYWLEGYGGGLWLPFADATTGVTTYGGGRYLYDTIKGADLGVRATSIVLDFNYAYNPSCAYDERWSCPLSPAENRLGFAVEAGERLG